MQQRISFSLDPLSLLMMFVITVVGFLIHLYSAEFMLDEEGYSRFFAYMNLFVGSMLTLVLADNLAAPLPGMGRRGALQLSPDRLLVLGPGKRQGGAQGLHRDPHRRHGHGARPVSSLYEPGHAQYPVS